MQTSAPTHQAAELPWIHSAGFHTAMQKGTLPRDLAKIASKFATDGYVIIDPEIPKSVILGAVKDVAGRYHATYEPYYADETRLQGGWVISDNIRRIATAPRILEILNFLYGRESIPFQTLNFRCGSEQRTHSDTIHFHSLPAGFMCGVWVALEDVDGGNGPLHYYPGSQKLPLYTLNDLGISGATQSHPYENYPLYEDFVQDRLRESGLPRIELKVDRGQALIWDANLFHGGSPILERGRTRMSQVTHYYFKGCRYYCPLMSDLSLDKIDEKKIANLVTGEIYEGRTSF